MQFLSATQKEKTFILGPQSDVNEQIPFIQAD